MNYLPVLRLDTVEINADEHNRYCLNDLHKAAGGEKRHSHSYWLENQQTKQLIEELEKEITGIPVIFAKQGLGTFVVKELVYAYAMWISPAFNLKVIRAFDEQQRNMTPGEMLVYQAQRFLENERRVSALEQEMNNQKAQISAIVEGEGFYTVVGFAKKINKRINAQEANVVGRQASKICQNLNINRGTAPHPQFGHVYTYPEEVLSELLH